MFAVMYKCVNIGEDNCLQVTLRENINLTIINVAFTHSYVFVEIT